MCCACHLMVKHLCDVSWKYVKAFKTSGADTKIVNTQRAISLKIGKPELRFMCSACRLIMFNICVKFHENMSSNFKLMEQI